MSDKLKYQFITKEEFEQYLHTKYKNKFHPLPEEFYTYDWQILQKEERQVERYKEIMEYMYVIQLNEEYGVLIYSAIDRDSNESRPSGGDAIRLVPVKLYYFDPIRKSEKRINRIETWRGNFEKRMNDITKELGIY